MAEEKKESKVLLEHLYILHHILYQILINTMMH